MERRHKCQVPEELRFHTKPQLAAEMGKAIRGECRLPCKYVVADGLYPTFRTEALLLANFLSVKPHIALSQELKQV